MNEIAYVLLGMCLGGFIATFYLSYQFSKGFERMKEIGNDMLRVASELEYLQEWDDIIPIEYGGRLADLANDILKECE